MTFRYDKMISGMDPLEQACRQLEADVNEGGWDQRPHFYMFSLVGDYKTADLDEINQGDAKPGGLLVQEVLLPDFCYMDPANGVITFMKMLIEEGTTERGKEVALALNRLVPDKFFGFGQVYEAWGLEGSSREEIEEASAGRTVHLHPDRIELRGLQVATRDGRFATLQRKRDDFPEYQELDPTDEDHVMEGRVPDGLRLMTSFLADFDDWRATAVEEMESEGQS